jgi:hypothetical protein
MWDKALLRVSAGMTQGSAGPALRPCGSFFHWHGFFLSRKWENLLATLSGRQNPQVAGLRPPKRVAAEGLSLLVEVPQGECGGGSTAGLESEPCATGLNVMSASQPSLALNFPIDNMPCHMIA